MLDLITLPKVIGALLAIIVMILLFIITVIAYFRYYSNVYEPVYTVDENDGAYKKNYVASMFVKLVIYSTIADQCLTNIESIAYWTMVSIKIAEWPKDTILSLEQMHKKVVEELRDELSEHQYEQIRVNMIKLELSVDSNFMKTKIPTPPYLKSSTYSQWLTDALQSLNSK